METKLSPADLASDLADILERVRDRGERFVVEENGEPVATIVPPSGPPGITVRDLVARVGNLKTPGDGFADDLEAVQRENAQRPMTVPEWPD